MRAKPSPAWPRLAPILAGGVIVLAAFLAYRNSFTGPFIFDDTTSIVDNPTIRRIWPPWQALSPPREGGLTVSGRPLVNLSLAFNHALGGTAVGGYHALNLLLHTLAGLTLLGVVRRTLLQPALSRVEGPALSQVEGPVLRTRMGTAALPIALVVALLWTVHPLQTESVTYVVQRAESLMGLFYLLTVYCFIRGTERPAPGGWLVLSVTACLLGMASKEVMVTAPLLVLLYDRTFVAGTFLEAWRQRPKYYAALAGTWLLLAGLVVAAGNRGGTVGFGSGVAWWAYGATQFHAIVHYLRLSVWPHPLVLDSGIHWIRHATELASAALIVIALAAGTLVALRRQPVLGFIGAWFFAILAPTSLVPGNIQMIVEHRMYLPLAAVLGLVVAGGYALAGKRSLVLGMALAVGLGALTARRNEDYRSDTAIWSDTVKKCPDNARANNNLGHALDQEGRVAEAVAHYQEALRLKPDFAEVHANLGIALGELNRPAEAIREYEEAVRLKPDFAEAHGNLGVALAQTGRLAEAMGHFEAAVRLRPVSVHAHNNLGFALVQTGRVAEGIGHYQEALRIDSNYPDAHYNLGVALIRFGRVADAIEQFEAVVRIEPGNTRARDHLARLRALPPAH